MNRITLHGVLPDVFHESRNEAFVKNSQIWLRDVTFTKGENYLIHATSGAGKSSLCSFIYGLRNDFNGSIKFDGENINSFSIGRWTEIRTRHLAFLPQEMKLFAELTAMENVCIKNDLTHYRTKDEIITLMKRLGIDGKADSPVGKMSVGQQQRVAIIRALCQPYDFIIIDEPVSHLDAENNSTVASLISDDAAQRGASVIATSVGNTINIHNFKELHL